MVALQNEMVQMQILEENKHNIHIIGTGVCVLVGSQGKLTNRGTIKGRVMRVGACHEFFMCTKLAYSL